MQKNVFYCALAILVLVSCTQKEALEPVLAPTAAVVFSPCDSFAQPGEFCTDNCECLKPTKCLNNICALTKLENAESCADNAQCLSGYCTEKRICGGPDGASANFDCTREFTDDYEGNQRVFYTVCKYR